MYVLRKSCRCCTHSCRLLPWPSFTGWEKRATMASSGSSPRSLPLGSGTVMLPPQALVGFSC